MNKVLHKRSSVITDGNPKLPSSEMLDYGELAINYADGAEVITLKNTSNEIVEFRSKNYFEDIINNNELVVSKALIELNEKVDNIEGEYYTKQEIDNKGYLTEHQDISGKQDVISDLATIRDNAAKGATALQSYTEQYKGTVTGVKINGTTKNPSSGIVDLGTVITAHQTLKTINGESIVGSGDITISGGSSNSNVQAVDTGDVLDDVTVNYATKTYVDGLVGDINSILESIING